MTVEQLVHPAPQAFPPKNEALRRWKGRCLQANLSADRKHPLLPCGLDGPTACGWPIRPRPG
jgi:hypothetical protein